MRMFWVNKDKCLFCDEKMKNGVFCDRCANEVVKTFENKKGI